MGEPIIEAEKNLKLMIETDEWKVEEALQYLEKAQLVWCLKGLVLAAREKLSVVLQQRVLDESNAQRGKHFDWLLCHATGSGNDANPSGNASQSSANFQSNPELQLAATDICRRRLSEAVAG